MNLNVKKVLETFKVVNKDYGEMTFKLKPEQEDVYNTIADRGNKKLPCRIIILKARQLGFSTLSVLLMLSMCLCMKNQNMLLVTHREDASQELYDRIKFALSNLPKELQPVIGKNNSEEIEFVKLANITDDGKEILLNNRIHIKTVSATGDDLGRGSSYTFVHASEYPRWKGNKSTQLISLLSSIADNGIFIIESTAKGFDDFKGRWDSAVANKNLDDPYKWIPKFYSWANEKSYRHKFIGGDLTEEEKILVKEHNLELDQIQWRRDYILNNCNGDINLFKQEMPLTPEEAFLSSGECIFDTNVLNNRIYKLRTQNENNFVDKGYFIYKIKYDDYTHERKIVNYKWISDLKNGYITVFKEINSRIPYVIGIDTSGGSGNDYHAGVVLDNISSDQIATIHNNKLSSFELSCQLYCMGMMFNKALLIPETNFSSDVVANLKEFGYPNIYVMQAQDISTFSKNTNKLGFKTTTITRPLLISKLVEYVNNCSEKINDIKILQEAQNFVRFIKEIDGTTKVKEQANYGKHDDLIMALGISLYGRESGQQSFDLLPVEEVLSNKGNTLFDSFFNVSNDDENTGGYYLTYD